MRSFVKYLGDYKQYLSNVSDMPLFNNELFLKNRAPKYKEFYSEIIETQIFRSFLVSEMTNLFSYFQKMCIRHNNSINNNSNYKRSNSKNMVKRSTSAVRASSFSTKQNTNTANVSSHNIVTHKNSSFIAGESSDSQSKSSFYELKTSDNIDTYMINPYFVNYPMLKMDIPKIEELIQEKFECIYCFL